MGLSDIKLTDIDFESVEACTRPRVLRRYIALLEEDGGYFHQLLHAARQKLASLTGCKTGRPAKGTTGGASAAEIAAARQDLLAWVRSLEGSSELNCNEEWQDKTASKLVSFTENAIEELEDPASGAEKAVCMNENPRDGRKWGGKREVEPCPEELKEERGETQKAACLANSGEIKGERRQGTHTDAEDEKKNIYSGETGNTSGGTDRPSEQQKNADEELEKANNGGGERAEERTGVHGLADGCSNTTEAPVVPKNNVRFLTSTTEAAKPIESNISDESALGVHKDCDEKSPATKEKSLSLTSRKLVSRVGNHERGVGTVGVREKVDSPQGNRGSQTKSDTTQHRENEFPSHSLGKQRRKICVQVDDEETDECSGVSGSEED